MNYKKNTNKVLFFLKTLLLSPVIIFIILIYPIVRIKIFEIETRAIGHMSLPIEIFASEVKQKIHNKKKTIYIWFPNKKISNKFLYKKWKKVFLILPRVILEPVYIFFMKTKKIFGKTFLIPYRHWSEEDVNKSWQDKDIYDVLIQTRPNIIFSKNEIKKGNKYLSKLNIKKNDRFVLFFLRNPYYYIQNKIYQSYQVNLRDTVSLDYYSSVDYLNSINCKTILMGANYDVKEENKSLIYYNQSCDRGDFLDIFLPFNCKYMVASASGISTMPALNRKKTLIINFSELNRFGHIDSYYYPLYIPKKFRSLKTGSLITYKEVLDLKLSEYIFNDELERAGFKIEENTRSEITEAVKEMEYFINYGKQLDNSELAIQNKFEEIYFNKFNYRIKYTKICTSFLKKNRDLFI